MKKHYKETRQKIQNFVNSIEDTYYTPISKLNITSYVTKEPVSYGERTSGEKKILNEGDSWGELFDCAWFHFEGQVPKAAQGQKVVLLIDVNGEGCIFNDKGEPILGLTSGTSVYEYETSRKRVFPVCEVAQGQEVIDIWMDAGCNDLFGRYTDNGKVVEAKIAIANTELRDMYYDFAVLNNVLDNIDDNSPRYFSILHTMNDAINTIKTGCLNTSKSGEGLPFTITSTDNNTNNFASITSDSINSARSILKKELDKKNGDVSLNISAIGHAHIDLAWLWPIRETVRKGARTFATALALMDRYPDYKFGASQPQLYVWIKEYYPSLFERIKERVKEGRWELQGGMWVEPDTNITGGESLVRQLLYGTRFFKQEFDFDVKNLWLPDVFGYTGSLPQILKKSNIDYFMTMKLSWNKINTFPYHTFLWKGIDGTGILCHMLPEGNYNSAASATSLKIITDNFKEKGLSDEVLMLYGIGDGGGGPAPHHQERLQRLENFEGLPKVKQDFAMNFFERINKDIDKYPSWSGELYLEQHRGTYTTQAKVKLYNRKIEILLREAEYACVLAMKYAGEKYPQEQLETIWKEVLLYQFHDILPGSSIKRVYDECLERYEILIEQVETIINKAYKALTIPDNNHTLINSLATEREGYIKVDEDWMKYSVQPMSSVQLSHKDDTLDNNVTMGDNHIENEYLKVIFDETGFISSVYDKKNNRNVTSEGKLSNVLNVYMDNSDAWNIDIYYDEREPEQVQLVSQNRYIDGPKVAVESTYKYNQSTIIQTVSLTSGCEMVRFDTQVDWHESMKMLRTSFPIDVYTTEATCNIQFGSIKRPTHRNTSWDMAKYEVCAHKWVDMSDYGYGVSLINDCKYGHKIIDNIIDLNLLRSTLYPGEEADQGKQQFSYALFPHKGNCGDSDVERKALEFNVEPVIMKSATMKTKMPSLLKCDMKNIIIDTVKKCEDSDNIIIRMHENVGMNTTTTVQIPEFTKAVALTDMMENDIENIEINDKSIALRFKPFEILTIKVKGDCCK